MANVPRCSHSPTSSTSTSPIATHLSAPLDSSVYHGQRPVDRRPNIKFYKNLDEETGNIWEVENVGNSQSDGTDHLVGQNWQGIQLRPPTVKGRTASELLLLFSNCINESKYFVYGICMV